MRVALPQSSKVSLLIEVSLCMHLKVINLSNVDDNDGGNSDVNDDNRKKKKKKRETHTHTFHTV